MNPTNTPERISRNRLLADYDQLVQHPERLDDLELSAEELQELQERVQTEIEGLQPEIEQLQYEIEDLQDQLKELQDQLCSQEDLAELLTITEQLRAEAFAEEEDQEL